MTNFLSTLRPYVLERIKKLHVPSNVPSNQWDFCRIFKHQPALIAEIKFASPSRGVIYHGSLTPVQIAHAYLVNGAAALSVLTEPHYFRGRIDYLREIRHAFPDAHLLLKDFILSEKQLIQALINGANAILLIVAFLDLSLLRDLYFTAEALGLTSIIEVHNQSELEIAGALGAKVIGVNNRNLHTLKTDVATSHHLITLAPKNTFLISESGLNQSTQIQSLSACGYHGFLVGSHLMATENPGLALKRLRDNDAS